MRYSGAQFAGRRRPAAVTVFAAAALLCLTTVVTNAANGAEYYGKYLGPMKSYHHGLGGDVYAVDARTLHVRNFVYDGEGPAAYFYGSGGQQPGSNGYRIRDEKASTNPLKKYRNEHLTITLPEGLTLHDIKWFYVWCEDFSVNFGDVKIPHNLNYPKPQKIDRLSGIHGVSSENIVVVDAQTLLIPGFSYDGEAPDAKFWVGAGDKPTPQGVRVADENGKEVPLRRYDRKTIVLTLPGDLTVFDVGHFGVWCEAFTVDFGHVAMPSSFNVPPSLKMLGVLPQSKLNCEVLHEPLGYEVRWAIAGDSIVVQLVAKLEVNQYMSFGISGSPTVNRMVGGDVVVAGVDQATISGFAQDYYLLDKSQCVVQQETGQVSGSCPDSNIQGPAGESVRLLNAAIINGYSIVTYQRPLKSKDNLDLSILTNKSQPIIWAIGPLNDKLEVSYHLDFSKETVKIDFGRSPEWNCPIPDTDAKSDVVHNEVTTTAPTIITPDITTSPSSIKEATTSKKIRPRPVPKPAPVQNYAAWDIPPIQCYEPDDGVFYAQMGPTGGKHGYSAITGHVGWGISWYINGLLIPEINVVRGQTYTFVVEGGLDSETPAKYHPFYITDDPVGGYGYKTAGERESIRIFAGVGVSKSGEVIPTGVGRSCVWTPDPAQPSADEFVSFGAYQRTLTLVCDNGDPGIVQWTPDAETPDTVYYQCFTHRHLGWKINVLDACDKQQPAAETGAPLAASASAPEDLQSRGSIQYATRVRPDASGDKGPPFYDGPGKGYATAANNNGDDGAGDMPPVPPELVDHLRNDFRQRVSPAAAAAPRPNSTLYAYPPSSDDHAYYGGNVPFYAPRAQHHYGSPQPMRTVPVPHNYHVNNNYRPVRQPSVPHFHVQQQPQPNALHAAADPQRVVQQMVFGPKQPVAVKHGYRLPSGKRLPSNGARHSVVYKKPVYKTFDSQQPRGYGPTSPVPQPLATYHRQQQPYSIHQQQQQQQQQQQPFVQPQQPATSMSQSVSVSYSTSKLHHHQPQSAQRAPVQSRQETFGQPRPRHQQYHQPQQQPLQQLPQPLQQLPQPQQQPSYQGGFNPNTVVIEGGFKPMVSDGGDVPRDRSDNADESSAAATEPAVETHREKKTGKKLISRKLATKRADGVAANGSSAAENVDGQNWEATEARGSESVQQTERPMIVL